MSFEGKEEQEFLEKSRSGSQSPEWKDLYQERAGIEGTISQSVRGYRLRQTRYIGKAKTHLHYIAVASAVNIIRGVAWLECKPLEKTRVSRFAGLAATNHFKFANSFSCNSNHTTINENSPLSFVTGELFPE